MKKRNVVIGIAAICFAALGLTLPAGDSDDAITFESKKANDFFEEVFQKQIERSPQFQTYLGIKKDYGKWDDISDDNARLEHKILLDNLSQLQTEINYATLDQQTRTSYDLFVQDVMEQVEAFPYRFHNYPVNQMFGLQSRVPAFLINFHRIESEQDARDYISRLNGVKPLFDQLIKNMEHRRETGILPPTFVYDHVIRDAENVLKGKPFKDTAEPGTLLADFLDKIGKVESIDKKTRESLIAEATEGLKSSMRPAYSSFIGYMKKLKAVSTEDAGVWKLPDGDAFYRFALKRTTTTNLTADEIHNIGLKEVARIHGEMKGIMKTVGFEGSLQDFFEFMRTDPRFYYTGDDEGKQKYLAHATAVIDTMKGELDKLFLTKPKADIVVKAVEPFREESAGKAFYQRGTPDGSRPGAYYANLFDMTQMPVYMLEALAYHEGIPGHHMQISIAQELEGIPRFRKFLGFTAYTEGWGLYSELIPKEMGFYKDPYSDFGRLSAELWRACRLVVDTGIHAEKWTREEGITYYKTNTPNAEGDCVKMVERHIIAPGQATGYKIGMLKILELREMAKEKLGDKFDIREFHDVLLTNGAVPLNLLEGNVEDWVASKN